MKRRLFKIVSVISVLSIVLAGVSGCKKTEQTSGGKMTIKWAGAENMSQDSVVERYLEDKYNVELEIISMPNSYYEKLGAMIAGGNVPDVMFMNELENWQPLAKQGVFAEIDMNMVEEVAPDYVKLINDLEPNTWNICKMDDALYTLPRYTGREDSGAVLWRKDWLDKVGVTKIPETLDEFEEAAWKISNEDPDGNGKKDTYALTAWGNFSIGLFDEIFGAYGVMPEQWNLIDGKIVHGDVADGAKLALERLHKWYEEGIIDPEFITETVDGEVQKFLNGRLGTYTTSMNNYSEYTFIGQSQRADWEKRNPEAEFAWGPLPIGPDGKSG